MSQPQLFLSLKRDLALAVQEVFVAEKFIEDTRKKARAEMEIRLETEKSLGTALAENEKLVSEHCRDRIAEIEPQTASPRSRCHHHPLDRTLVVSISPPTSPIRHSYVADETLLLNLLSTIPNPHPFKLISLFFSSLTQPHLRDHAAKIAPQHRQDRASEILAHDPP
ncbi:hypothetical protein CMV_014526 [Castanea mollissima]|uniref:Uncharacterized protein n=1 Tax=Castanea mollissima TaxID=60419 RepID=A0A8J4RBH2_9ROSI|nr:hypothetical protein CMV_014526 [Castanea mollissima]